MQNNGLATRVEQQALFFSPVYKTFMKSKFFRSSENKALHVSLHCHFSPLTIFVHKLQILLNLFILLHG